MPYDAIIRWETDGGATLPANDDRGERHRRYAVRADPNASRSTDVEPASDLAFFLAIYVLGVALLMIFAVVAIAGVLDVARVLPFVAVPFGLVGVSALLVWRWAKAEAEAVAVREADSRSADEFPRTTREC